MFFVSARDLEVFLIFSILAGVLIGLNPFLVEAVLLQETYVFYRIDFFFILLKYVLLGSYAFYIAQKWRNIKWLKDSLLLVLVTLISILCSMQMKIATDEGIIVRNMIKTEAILFEDIRTVQINFEASSFAGHISYTMLSEDNKYKYYDPFNIHNGEQLAFLDSKIDQFKPTYEIEPLHRFEYKKLLAYERTLIDRH